MTQVVPACVQVIDVIEARTEHRVYTEVGPETVPGPGEIHLGTEKDQCRRHGQTFPELSGVSVPAGRRLAVPAMPPGPTWADSDATQLPADARSAWPAPRD